MRGLVVLKEGQCYGGCLGAIVCQTPFVVNGLRSYEVYIDGLGTVVRTSLDLEPVTEEAVASGAVAFVTPAQWAARVTVRSARAALLAAVKAGRHEEALRYAGIAAKAEIELEEAA